MAAYEINDLPDGSGLKVIANVPIAMVGEDWHTSTGIFTITESDLAAAVDALDDPAVKTPRVKIGHIDPRFTPDGDNGVFDGTPTLGKFTNLRIGDNGQTLYADAMGVPEWFANIAPYAFPNRSIEGYYNAQTATGKTHDFVITAVSLLGVELPAIETLDDLQILFSAEGPEGVQVFDGERVAATKGGPMPQTKIAASTSIEDVRRAFFEEFATEDSGRYWWWIRAVYVDPSILICTDDNDGLWAVPYTVTDNGAEFGDPAEVFTQYVETDGGKIAASKLLQRPAAAVYNKAGGSRPEEDKRTQEVHMARVIHASVDVPVLRSRLGLTAEQLPDDATDEQINEALAGLSTSVDPAQTPNPPESAEPGTAAAGTPQPGGVGEGTGAVGPGEPGSQVQAAANVDPEALAALQRDAALGREARNEQIAARRNGAVESAIMAGKIPPARREHYRTLMSADEEGTTALLASLEAGVVPVAEEQVGSGNAETSTSADYPQEWLSDGERARIAAANAGQPATTRVVQEAS